MPYSLESQNASHLYAMSVLNCICENLIHPIVSYARETAALRFVAVAVAAMTLPPAVTKCPVALIAVPAWNM